MMRWDVGGERADLQNELVASPTGKPRLDSSCSQSVTQTPRAANWDWDWDRGKIKRRWVRN